MTSPSWPKDMSDNVSDSNSDVKSLSDSISDTFILCSGKGLDETWTHLSHVPPLLCGFRQIPKQAQDSLQGLQD